MSALLYITVVSLFYCSPLIVVVLLVRKRMARVATRSLLAFAVACAAAYVLADIEHDIWRYGMPSASYLISAYLPYVAIVGAVGWLLGVMMTPPSHIRNSVSSARSS